ncbi:MAG: hypothetical protein M3142_00715, partial [Bacteroidota bacterium]|nr:hypothetical protein [Bacteroidota bacterium]
AYVKKKHLIINGSFEEINSVEKLISLLSNLLEKCTSSDSIFIKPSDGIGGGGVYKIHKGSFSDTNNIKKLFADLQKNNYIIQEAVIQHEIMNRLNPSSLNSIRIHTYRKPNGEIGIASALSRMGYGGSHVDNITAGGIFVSVDIDKGCLEKYGYNFIARGGGSYTIHPDTKTVFAGFQLPFFSQSQALVCQAASYFENKVIGWDVAITPNGPILVEGNHNPHLMMAQTACGGFRHHPIYKELFKEYL